MYPNGRKPAAESQIISAEIVSGLLLTVLYRIISKNIFPLVGLGQIRLDGEPFEMTRSLVCVWFASNVKFLLFRNSKAASLTAHSTSRLVASLALLFGTCWGGGVFGTSSNQVPVLDLVVFCSFVVSSFTLMALDQGQEQGQARQARAGGIMGGIFVGGIFVGGDAQRFFLNVDFCATLLFGLLWLVFPDWLLGSQYVSVCGADDLPLPLHLTRAFGAMMVGDSFVALTSPSTHLGKDRASLFSSRAVATLVLLSYLLHSHLVLASWSSGRVWVGVLGAGLWAGNSVLGYLASRRPPQHTHQRSAQRA
ncbi:uncharacterized protein LOC134089363 [Sardina pilchardus]|uniref:uncharacterized protein LOC134089363 n=1 Tax=Sardina pilchardus TaxID=27697 RepID=UPI002E133282